VGRDVFRSSSRRAVSAEAAGEVDGLVAEAAEVGAEEEGEEASVDLEVVAGLVGEGWVELVRTTATERVPGVSSVVPRDQFTTPGLTAVAFKGTTKRPESRIR